MSSLQPLGGMTSGRSAGRTSRAIARIGDQTEVATVAARAEAAVHCARLDALDEVAARGLQGVALVTQLEQQLAQAVPLATSRLQAIGDMHALAAATELTDFTHRLR